MALDVRVTKGAEVRILRRLQFFKSNDFEPGMLDIGLGMRLGIGDMKFQPVVRRPSFSIACLMRHTFWRSAVGRVTMISS